MQLNEFFFTTKRSVWSIRLLETKYHRARIGWRIKWIALCAHDSTPGPETSPYASLDALFRASKMHVRVYTV